jgi:hypothetical protein
MQEHKGPEPGRNSSLQEGTDGNPERARPHACRQKEKGQDNAHARGLRIDGALCCCTNEGVGHHDPVQSQKTAVGGQESGCGCLVFDHLEASAAAALADSDCEDAQETYSRLRQQEAHSDQEQKQQKQTRWKCQMPRSEKST